MVEFITLLLGLAVGPQTVEVDVQVPATHVELRLDGRQVARINGEPWRARVDFGARLEPRRLEALAFDTSGKQVDSALQIVNYARRNYEAVLLLGASDEEGGRPGSVVWEALLDRKPKSIELTLDGREIAVNKTGAFELPPQDLGRVHSLSAVLSFANGHSAQADLVFGGVYGEQVSSALTAVPLLAPPEHPLPPPEEMADWFWSAGRKLNVFAKPKAGLRLMIVRDPDLRDELHDLVPELARHKRMPPRPVVGSKDSVRFVPISTMARHPGHFRAVEVTPPKLRFGLWDLISRSYPRQPVRGKRELWAAVAAAGLGAVEGDHRRAVLVLLPRKPRDDGAISASQAIGYLRSVRAPHFIWAPRERDLPRFDAQLAANVYIGGAGLLRLFDDLEASLRSQRMIWLEGLHFPAAVQLKRGLDPAIRLAE